MDEKWELSALNPDLLDSRLFFQPSVVCVAPQLDTFSVLREHGLTVLNCDHTSLALSSSLWQRWEVLDDYRLACPSSLGCRIGLGPGSAGSGPFGSRRSQQPGGKLAGLHPCTIIATLPSPPCSRLVTGALHLGLPEPLLFVCA